MNSFRGARIHYAWLTGTVLPALATARPGAAARLRRRGRLSGEPPGAVTVRTDDSDP
jgi:hypothetical protein